MADAKLELVLDGGKFRFYTDERGALCCDRHGQYWRDFVGDKAVHALFDQVIALTPAAASTSNAERPSHWDDDPEYPSDQWRHEVIHDDTRLGYLEWGRASTRVCVSQWAKCGSVSLAPHTQLSAEQLTAAGYRCTSRNHGRASRIDRPDWQRVIARHMGRTLEEVRQARSGDLEDYYRRVLSRDTVTLRPEDVTFPSSSFDSAGYVDWRR